MVSVAPNFFAISSFDSRVSSARMRSAPAIAAPWTAFRPTPPQPNTATVAPGSTLAVLNTAPTPVVTAQPTSAARSSGTFGSIFTTLSTDSVAYSAITPQPEKMLSGLPSLSCVQAILDSAAVGTGVWQEILKHVSNFAGRHLPHM